jgi:hypothetical protein
MPSWSEITEATPDLAGRVKAAFEAHKHKVMATLRADGSPRVSGTEVDISGGELWLGSMLNARKALDLQRDPRVAIHSAPLDVELSDVPDAKIAGRAVEITDDAEKAAWTSRYQDEGHELPPEPFHLFRLDIDEIVCTSVVGDKMIVDAWHSTTGTTRTER